MDRSRLKFNQTAFNGCYSFDASVFVVVVERGQESTLAGLFFILFVAKTEKRKAAEVAGCELDSDSDSDSGVNICSRLSSSKTGLAHSSIAFIIALY